MNDRDKKYLDKLKEYIGKHFKGYCIALHVSIDEQMKARVSVDLTLIDASRFQLPSFVITYGNVTSLIESLIVNRDKIMLLRD